MKTLLISTDFSTNAKHAAEYGYNLAKQIKANVILCNAVTVPAEMPLAGAVIWPMDGYDGLMEDSAKGLQNLKEHLEAKNSKGDFQPSIRTINERGRLSDIVNEIAWDNDVDMVIMGTHTGHGISQFFLDNHISKMIDDTSKPLLLIPPDARMTPIKKITFATDFRQPKKALESIFNLIPLARLWGAVILLTHVNNEKNHSPEFQKWVMQFLVELSNKANYPHIYYSAVRNPNVEDGLSWLCAHNQVDLLAMVHYQHGFFYNLLNSSHAKKMTDHLSIPLLIFPVRA